jgi:predicted enzyme related to lactoylglutathione lyase
VREEWLAILANGGKIVLDEYEIARVGRMIRFEDTEGNSVGAMHYV